MPLRKNTLIVPTPLVGGGTIYSNRFFLLRKFWPIAIFIVEDRYIYRREQSGIIKKLVQRRFQKLKDFFNFNFFEELSRIEVVNT